MNKILQKILLIEKTEIKTKLSKDRVNIVLEKEISKKYGYRACFSENGFCVAEKTHKSLGFGGVHNSFAPVAVANFSEQDGMTVISVLIRMRLVVCLLWYLLYLFSALGLIVSLIGLATGQAAFAMGFVLFLFCYGLPFFAFRRPAKRLKAFLENLLIYE